MNRTHLSMSREIKFRAWAEKNESMHYGGFSIHATGKIESLPGLGPYDPIVMQYTGLKDKNGVTHIYEGDIIDASGNIKGNIYESPQVYEKETDLVIEGMGTKAWRDTESIAMGRGCKYAE